MTAAVQAASPFGICGVFLVLLGAGLILDAEWISRGVALMIGGTCGLAIERRRSVDSARSHA